MDRELNYNFMRKHSRENQSVAAIVFQDNNQKVLLIKRKDVPVWVLPGGGIEEGESLAQAAARELQEETGYVVKIIRKVGEFHPKNKLTKLTHLYECAIISGEATENEEVSQINFFPVSKLPKLIPPPYPEWISYALLNEKKPLIKKTESVTYKALIGKLFRYPHLVAKHFYLRWKIRLLNR